MDFQLQRKKRRLALLRLLVPVRLREEAPSAGQYAPSFSSLGLLTTGAKSSGLPLTILYKRPTIVAAVLFLSILSGPPRFRMRDPEASLRGDLDWVVILHAVVWGLAGLWILWQFCKRFQAGRPLLRLRLPQILGLAMILALAASAWRSDAPTLTAFKVYQMLVSLLFTQIFAERFGVWTSLKAMLWGNGLLCVAIAVCAFLAPHMVWGPTELDSGPSRLYGDLIAQTGVVSVLTLILVLTSVRRLWNFLPLLLSVSLLALIVLSLMRTAYIAVVVFFTLVLLKRPSIKPLRRFACFLCLALLLTYACGRLPSVNHYRDPETLPNLGDRIGLWQYLTETTLSRSPWLGLGYYSASRIHAPEYNPSLGTAHSMFFEVLSGGGVLSFALLIALCVTLSAHAARLLYLRRDRLSFTIGSLLVACLLFGLTEETIDSGPVAICFWCLAAILPWFPSRPAEGYFFARKETAYASS